LISNTPGIYDNAKESLLSAQCTVWQNTENIFILSVTGCW